MRINKFLSEYGICSRRMADRYINEKRVFVNGLPAVMGQQVDPEKDEILFDQKKVGEKPERIIIAYNKPAGVVCSTVSQGKEKNDIISVLGLSARVFPVGRLDRDSTGLILLTNDGELSDRVLRSGNGHEKEYLIRTDRDFSDDEIALFAKGGIALEENRSTKPCRIYRLEPQRYDVVLTEGMNRQIRRVCAYFGKEVLDLCRIRFMNIELGGLKQGEYRFLSKEETDGLYSLI